MRHNPDNVPSGVKIWDHYPEIKRVPDLISIDMDEWEAQDEKFVPDKNDIHKMLKFVIFMCSQESPHYFESDYDARVKACMRSCNISRTEVIFKMIDDRHWWFRRMLVAYTKAFSKTSFMQWLSSRTMAFNMMEVMMAKPDPGQKDIKGFVKASVDASGELESLMQRITQLEQQLFPTDEIMEMISMQSFFDTINTAESYAKDFSDKFE